jgi:hypothetical protein
MDDHQTTIFLLIKFSHNPAPLIFRVGIFNIELGIKKHLRDPEDHVFNLSHGIMIFPARFYNMLQSNSSYYYLTIQIRLLHRIFDQSSPLHDKKFADIFDDFFHPFTILRGDKEKLKTKAKNIKKRLKDV